jgi:hypothetical protein
MRVLGITKGSKVVADLLQLVREWQLENPKGRKEDLKDWLRSEWAKKKVEVEEPEKKRKKSE